MPNQPDLDARLDAMIDEARTLNRRAEEILERLEAMSSVRGPRADQRSGQQSA